MLALLALAQLLLPLALAAAGAAGTPSVECTDKSCIVVFGLKEDKVHRVELFPEQTRLLTASTTFSINGAEDVLAPQDPLPGHKRYQTKFDAKHWGTALIKDGTSVVDAVFLTEEFGAIEFREGVKVPPRNRRLRRRLGDEEAEETDLVFELPEGQPWLIPKVEEEESLVTMGKTKPAPVMEEEYELQTLEGVNIMSAESGSIVPFFPGCFPEDEITHTFKMNIALDYGTVEALTQGLTTDAAKMQRVMQDLEHSFSVGKLIYRSQFNVNLELVRVTLGSARDALPLSRNKNLGSCSNALGAFQEMKAWNDANRPTDAGHTMLLSNCFSGIIGTSYIGSLCGTSNYGVSVNSWLTIFHELGHAFGMNHKFESGQGGIMDYGGGEYNGVVQFHAANKNEVCPFLSYLVNGKKCTHFTKQIASASCGDGILDKTEQCECIDRSTSCGKCKQCKLPDAQATECSARDFVLRTRDMDDLVVAHNSLLASAECCTADNKFAPAKTLCGADKYNVCSLGQCTPVCSTFLSYNNPSCGFDSTGCLLGCVDNSRCRFDFIVGDHNYHALPKGSKCTLENGAGAGKCYETRCATAAEFAILENGGSLPQENSETTSSPSIAPPVEEEVTTPAPSVRTVDAEPRDVCLMAKKRGPCKKRKGCSWCAKAKACKTAC